MRQTLIIATVVAVFLTACKKEPEAPAPVAQPSSSLIRLQDFMTDSKTKIQSHFPVTAATFSPYQGEGWKVEKDYVSILDKRAVLILPESKRKTPESRLYFRARTAGTSPARTLKVATQGVEIASFSLSKNWSEYELQLSTRDLKKPNVRQLQFTVTGEGKKDEPVADFQNFRFPAYSWGRTKVKSEVRSCLLTLVPSIATFQIQIPAGKPVLFFGYALSSPKMERTAFQIKVDGNSLFQKESDSRSGWMDERLDLGSYAGRSVKLELSTAAVSGGQEAQAIWSSPEIYNVIEKVNRPNIILFSVDTLRKDRVGKLMPNLVQLAGKSTVFNNAYCTFPSTLSSHTSVMTGLYVASHQVARPTTAVPRGKRISQELPTIAELASGQKYFTAAITDGGFVSSFYGFDQGFQQYADNEAGEKLRNNVVTVDRAIRWLDVNSERPFFLFLHTYKVHEPFSPPADFFRKLYPTTFPPGEDTIIPMEWLFRVVDGKVQPTDTQKQQVRDCYDAEVQFFDQNFGRLLATLKNKGLDQNTVILVFGDHGEQLFDHGNEFGHGKTLVPEEIQVPFVLYLPGKSPSVRNEVVSLVDVLPTLAHLMNAKIPAGLDGVDLMQPPQKEGTNRSIYYEVTFADIAQWGIQNHEFKMVVSQAGKESFYDIRKLPPQPIDLVSANPRAVKIMKDLLAGYIRKSTTPSAHTPATQDHEESKELREQLKALGYIN